MEQPVTLTIFRPIEMTTQTESGTFIVSNCILSLFRPSSEEIKEGRILKNNQTLTKVFFLRQAFGWFSVKSAHKFFLFN